MIQRHWKKRVCSLLVAFAMTATLFFPFGTKVYAAANQLPTKEQFVTVDELKQFNTVSSDDIPAAKVYFGIHREDKIKQQWWITGSQDKNSDNKKSITLFAASPLNRTAFFNKASTDQPYDENWDCFYPNENPKDVYPTHYGASSVREEVRGMWNDIFSWGDLDDEFSMVDVTEIYTNDEKYQDAIGDNSQDSKALSEKSVYSIKDELYLPYGEEGGNYITVGENKPDSISVVSDLNCGLRVDRDYWGEQNFWLRAPYHNDGKRSVLFAEPDLTYGEVMHTDPHSSAAIQPAFKLKLSSPQSPVIFASAAPAATSTGDLQVEDTDGNGAFTLRYKSDNLGSVSISYDKQSVFLTNAPTDKDRYLVVQNSAGAKAKKITNETSVSAKDMGLENFENCKVWLETTDAANRITYATMAKENQGYMITVQAGEDITVTNGRQEVVPNTAITPITVEAADGYYLPESYITNLQSLNWNGLKVEETDSGFTISGTPTNDVNLILPQATVAPIADTPQVTISKTSTSITATVTNHKPEFGDIEYKWDNGSFETNKSTLLDLQPNTTHQLKVRFTGDGIYQASAEYSSEITTLQDGNTVIVVPTNLTTTYKTGLKLSEVELPTDSGWSWVNGNTALSAGTKSYPATFDTRNLESTTDFLGVDGYDANTHKVTRNIEVKVNKADSQVNITTQSLDKIYDANAVNNPIYKTSGDGEVNIRWQEKSTAAKAFWKDLDKAPSTVGSYRVVVELTGNENYNSASTSLEFVISKATNVWTEELSITGWTYNEKANAPSAKAQFGDVFFTYSSEENGTYTSDVPVNAGKYYVKANVAGTENYTGLESAPMPFEIAKAVPAPEKITGLVLEQGEALSNIQLPKQFKWVDETLTANDLGTHTFKAVYTPEDTDNYETMEVDIEVKVVSKQVNPDQSGTNGQNTDKQDKDNANSDKNNVKTNDQTNAALLASLLSISAIGIAALAVLRKKEVKNK